MLGSDNRYVRAGCIKALLQNASVGDVRECLGANLQKAQESVAFSRSPVAGEAPSFFFQFTDFVMKLRLNFLRLLRKALIGGERIDSQTALQVEGGSYARLH